MKLALVIVALGLMAGCATVPHKTLAPGVFAVDQFIGLQLEYAGTNALAGVDTRGPTSKEFECTRSMSSAISQGLPAGHRYVTDCLHVKFVGPLPHGAVVPTPVSGTPFEWLTVGAEYSALGDFVGAQPLHPAPDLKTCIFEARDLLDTNYGDGSVPKGNSLLLYCLPVPILEDSPKTEGGIV